MSWWSLLAVAVALSMDACAVAMASSVTFERLGKRRVFRLGFHFGLFQALMPILGWLLGRRLGGFLHRWDHWLAFGLLAGLGMKGLVEALKPTDDVQPLRTDPTRGWQMVLLSIATSIDALAVGFVFALQGVEIWLPAALIGLVCCGLTVLGMVAGSRLGRRFGKRMEILGAVVLLAIGIKILIEHLWY